MKCIDSRGAFEAHIEICNGQNLFGNQNLTILIAKILISLGSEKPWTPPKNLFPEKMKMYLGYIMIELRLRSNKF
ncbi:MAG: hypothetical protein A2007_01870 [Verrucomicrobia bacterium GWC2_42_7]|nr:MAG: hypothetical protein A2007_01870 [Verrucomicrobia bacterium GWC2_42_7]